MADQILQRAAAEAGDLSRNLSLDAERRLTESVAKSKKILSDADAVKAEAHEALRLAKLQAQTILDESQKEARDIASKARKEAKDKREKADADLDLATIYALDIRKKAE